MAKTLAKLSVRYNMTNNEEYDFKIREIKQEKILLLRILKIIRKQDVLSQEILDSLSHELRTPIVTIKAYTDMLIDGKFGDLKPTQKEKLRNIKINRVTAGGAFFNFGKKERFERKPYLISQWESRNHFKILKLFERFT
ncbi:two-component system OmpR family phosphate regulon sensor histidine kinase PhoR protein [Marine Group I thaumarchaeote SCGC AAA799-P11]|uniref:Two-component system OmpR family phosphate regulon sensor histidine kinase PhoR protein n=1 Tax=Marine Group I thaumarchaeote SCGC AAA799-P11 TaxID=1502295 RepID=A0A087RZB6_9ARCH|nr:two-component system OmpR family phosphate regulon sensor histidine kinase PhoR protein [Marine Group I thaumarchaeote SCGC AAA799-P11]